MDSTKFDKTPRSACVANFLPKFLPRTCEVEATMDQNPYGTSSFKRKGVQQRDHPSKLVMRVRFPSSALFISAQGLDSTLLKRSLGSVPAARSQRLFGFALTLTISTSPSVPWKSAGLAVYSGSRLLAAVAAICRSEERLRGCRPAARTAAQIWP